MKILERSAPLVAANGEMVVHEGNFSIVCRLTVRQVWSLPIPNFLFAAVTIISFKIPAYSGSINAQGYHFHFLTQDRQAGGHLLECSVKDAVIVLDSIHQWQIDFPYDKRFYNTFFRDPENFTPPECTEIPISFHFIVPKR